MRPTNILVFCLLCSLLIGCAARGPVDPDSLRAALREHPEIVLDVLRANSADVLTIVEQGEVERRNRAEAERFAAEIASPKTPAIDLSRPRLGPAEAPVTIVAYSDFLCPYCGKAAEAMSELVRRHPGQIRFFFKHLPARPLSRQAAVFFEALAMQDQAKAWELHDKLFADQRKLAAEKDAALGEAIREVNPDMEKLQQAVMSPIPATRVNEDVKEAVSFGIDATPTFLINGVTVRGAMTVEDYEAYIGQLADKGRVPRDWAGPKGSTCQDCPPQ